jgi:CheY-like chemotaxis protein
MNGAKYSVLIVDDQKVNISELSRELRPEFKIFAAGNGKDALTAAEANLPDVILLDVLMADMDGFEVIAALKKSDKTKDIPVIFMTGLTDSESEEKGFALGAADFIRKPLSPAVVKQRVLNQIEKETSDAQPSVQHQNIHAPEARVLVVDDNGFNLRVACNMLDTLGIDAQAVTSGLTAIELIVKNEYDIVLMDHMMPEPDGMETTARIRDMGGKYERLPIVALTANTELGARDMFLANGFNDFIFKPLNTGELVRVLKTWLPPEKIQIKPVSP